MRYFPINLDVRGRKALVVGGGKVALRKTLRLLECGAEAVVVSPEFCAELEGLPGVTRKSRRYRSNDVMAACLVICATNCPETNRQVYLDAREAGIPCNVVDQPSLCSFTFPAVLSRGDLMVTISTGGASPALASRLRKELDVSLSPALETQLKLLAEMRSRVRRSPLSPAVRSHLLKAMASESLCQLIEQDGEEAARNCLECMFDEAMSSRDGESPASPSQ